MERQELTQLTGISQMGDGAGAKPGEALAVGIGLALLAMLLSADADTIGDILYAKFFTIPLPPFRSMLDTSLTPQQHAEGMSRFLICLGGGFFAGVAGSRFAPRREFGVGFTVLFACVVTYGIFRDDSHIGVSLYAAICPLLFPVFLLGGTWFGKRINSAQKNVPATWPILCANDGKPLLAVACGLLIHWLLPTLLFQLYSYLTTASHTVSIMHGQVPYPPYGIARVIEFTSSILAGYLCARLAGRRVILVGIGMMLLLVLPLIRADHRAWGEFLRLEFLRLGLVLIGMLVGWLHTRVKLKSGMTER